MKKKSSWDKMLEQSAARKRRIWELRRAGRKVSEIAKLHAISTARVYKILERQP